MFRYEHDSMYSILYNLKSSHDTLPETKIASENFWTWAIPREKFIVQPFVFMSSDSFREGISWLQCYMAYIYIILHIHHPNVPKLTGGPFRGTTARRSPGDADVQNCGWTYNVLRIKIYPICIYVYIHTIYLAICNMSLQLEYSAVMQGFLNTKNHHLK